MAKLTPVAQSNIGIGKPKSIYYYFGRLDHLLKNSARARYRPGVTTVTRATAFYALPGCHLPQAAPSDVPRANGSPC